jgi:hypothetical protein
MRGDFAVRLTKAISQLDWAEADEPMIYDLSMGEARAILGLIEAANDALETLNFIDSEYGLADPRRLAVALETLRNG